VPQVVLVSARGWWWLAAAGQEAESELMPKPTAMLHTAVAQGHPHGFVTVHVRHCHMHGGSCHQAYYLGCPMHTTSEAGRVAKHSSHALRTAMPAV
jgi:hypothetical protein